MGSARPTDRALTINDQLDLGYRTYVVFTAYNALVRDLPELGWRSKHSNASRALFEVFSDMERLLGAYLSQPTLTFYLNSPVIQEAIVDVQLELLRHAVTTADEAMAFLPTLMASSTLKGLRLKATQYKACVYSLTARRLRRHVRPHKALKAA